MRVATLLLAVALLPAALAADAPAPKGRAYAASELEALLDGLGYESRALDSGGRFLKIERPGYTVEVNVLVASDGGTILLYAPLRQWPDPAAAPEAVLTGMLRRSADLGPTRFYMAPAEGGHWVGLLRSVDNRGVLPRHVRENLDLLFEHARQTESLWNPEKWPTAAPDPTPAMGG